MHKVSLYDYYSFGFNYYILMNDSSHKTVEEFAKDIIRYSDFINDLDLKVTKSLLKMYGWNDNIKALNKLNVGTKKKKVVEPTLYDKIIELIKKADPTLDAELSIKTGYLLKEKRISTDKLIDEIDSIFSIATFLHLPDVARFDFIESGKCLAFDRNTASAFHSLRGTEDVLKFYYSNLTGKVATDTQTWGNFHSEIEAQITAGNIIPHPPKELMQNLNSLRIYYRNKTQHPQLIYDADEAQDLMFNCIKCVNEIIKDLKSRGIINDLPF
ncbi:hypothetical protein WMW71_04215 [Flavobacterium buctense]|uniref:HEPN domain-containing protein n=1 Tax=Flavobacterium buctense TaxID=1648146 RepID=A0ABU9DZA8_9FLAO|nr:hypothetical protein [Flavobacterium buctense]